MIEGNAGLVLVTVCIAAVPALAAIILELAGSKGLGADEKTLRYAFTGVTILGSWLLIGVIFSLHYARLYSHLAGPDAALPPSPTASKTSSGTSCISPSPSASPCRLRTSASRRGPCARWYWHNR